jgi:MFS transporter, DHA2 family, methylenomycin A resistance protein
VVATFVVGVLALVAFALVEHHQRAPLIDVSLFLRPAFAAANISAFLVFFAYVGGIIYFSVYFQQIQGHSAIRAGLDVATIGVATAIASTLSGRLIGRFGERWPLVAGLFIAGAGTLGLVNLQPDTPLLSLLWFFAILGAGSGLSGTPMSTIAMSAVDAAHAGMASAIVNSMRQVGQVFGVAVLGALVYAHVPGRHHGVQLGPAEAAAFVSGLHEALWVSAAALFAAAAIAVVLLWSPLRRA